MEGWKEAWTDRRTEGQKDRWTEGPREGQRDNKIIVQVDTIAKGIMQCFTVLLHTSIRRANMLKQRSMAHTIKKLAEQLLSYQLTRCGEIDRCCV